MNTVTSCVIRTVSSRNGLSCVCRRHSLYHRHWMRQSIRTSSASAEEKVIPPPAQDDHPKQYPEHIKSIVDQIAGLTLVEVADLNQLLKERLNIQDAPVMTMGGGPVAPAPAEQEEEEQSEKPREKTSFTVKLVKFDEAQKVKLIKEIKSLNTGMNLVQAKKFVESLPQMVKADIGKDEAGKLKEQLEAVGGSCEVE